MLDQNLKLVYKMKKEMMYHSYITSSVMCIGLVLMLLMTIGATTTTTTVGTPMKPMASVPPIKKSTLCTLLANKEQARDLLFSLRKTPF